MRKSLMTSIVIVILMLLMSSTSAARPNIVVIQTDDQALSQLAYMPHTKRLIQRQGINFKRYYTDYPICCPSRTSLLTGRYVHNHGVLVNFAPYAYYAFRDGPSYSNNIAVWLQNTGYETIHIGKFLNAYGDTDASEVPPGWSQWNTVTGDSDARLYSGFRVNDNREIRMESGYSSDFATTTAIQQINAAQGPFYMQVDYNAPHYDPIAPPGPTPSPKYANAFARTPLPENPSFDEGDLSDKPSFIRRLRRISPAQRQWIVQGWRNSLRSLQSVDDGVRQIVRTLSATGQLDNTYIVFTSDNGFFYGEHRIAAGKYLPYEPSAHLPLLIRGPGIKPGISNALVQNIDLAPTFAAIAGTTPTIKPDGQSLLPLLSDPLRVPSRSILLEGYTGKSQRISFEGSPSNAPVTDYFGVVTGWWKYIEYGTGARELYNLHIDPHEMDSLIHSKPRVVRKLRRLVRHMKTCVGSTCHVK